MKTPTTLTARATTSTRMVLPELAACLSFLRCAVILLPILLASCVTDSYVAINGNKSLTHKRTQFGGTTSFSRGDGSSEANDYQVSARDFFSTVGTITGTISYGMVTKADNASKSLTTQQANKQAAALAAQKQKDATTIALETLKKAP